MSNKQRNMLIGIIVGLVVVVGIVFGVIFFMDTDSMASSGDIEIVKANGGYEILKTDLLKSASMRDTQAVEIADILFEDVGIKNYEGLDKNSRRGNFAIYADGYTLDCFIRAGELANIYIGNIVVYKNPGVAVTLPGNVVEYSYSQYDILVKSFTKGLKIEEQVGKDLYEDLSILGINAFNEIKSGKLNNIKGFYGTEGMLQYFMVLDDTNSSIRNIYVVCDAFEPIEIYNSITSSEKTINDVRVTMGSRQGIANILAFKVQQASGLTATFPAALLNGDDSWLMVRNDSDCYIEVRAEVQVKEDKKEVKDFVLLIDYTSRTINYLKVDKKVYVGEGLLDK